MTIRSRNGRAMTAVLAVLALIVLSLVPNVYAGPPTVVRNGPVASLSPSSSVPSSVGADYPAPPDRLTTASLVSANCASSYLPTWLAYNPKDSSFWVAAPGECVEVIPANDTVNVSASYAVGKDPFGVAVDTSTGDVYVTNSGSDNVTVLDPTNGSHLAEIPVGAAPEGIAFDAVSGDLFVANNGSANVSVISSASRSVVATVPVGYGPVGVAVDPFDDRAFVANSGSNNVSVISTSTDRVVASVGVGVGPYGVALDNATDQVYVTNEGSNNVTVLNASALSVYATIPVAGYGIQLQGIAYDSGLGMMIAGGGWSLAVALNTSSQRVEWYIATDPSGVAYDPSTGKVCMTNTGNRSFSCVSILTYEYPAASLTFVENGLPAGTSWSVSVALYGESTTATGRTSDLTFGVGDRLYTYTVATVGLYEPTPASGNVTVYVYNTSSAYVVNITFAVASGSYLVTFNETGLPSGTPWAVNLSGVAVGSTGSSISFPRTNGTYGFSIAPTGGYTPTPSSGTVTVAGASVMVAVAFGPTPPPSNYSVDFVATGLPNTTAWSITIDGATYSDTGPVIVVILASASYTAQVGNVPGYLPAVRTINFTVQGANLTVVIAFDPLFTLLFVESGLPPSTNWSVTVGAVTEWTPGDSLAFALVAGSYRYTVAPVDAYTPAPPSGRVNVTGDSAVAVAFRLTFGPPPLTVYPVTFRESGLPRGTVWWVNVSGSFVAGDTRNLTQPMPNGTYAYAVSVVPGYVVAPVFGNFTVSGGTVNVSVTFAALVLGGGGQGTIAFAPLLLSIVLLAAGVVALVIGVVIGWAIGRTRTPPPPPMWNPPS